jgi:hypothetical protein
MMIQHDPFARGGYERESAGPGRCHGCGDLRRNTFRYVWVSDASTRGPSIFHRHQRDHAFCNFRCFQSYHS